MEGVTEGEKSRLAVVNLEEHLTLKTLVCDEKFVR